jgi:hypothetical protein
MYRDQYVCVKCIRAKCEYNMSRCIAALPCELISACVQTRVHIMCNTMRLKWFCIRFSNYTMNWCAHMCACVTVYLDRLVQQWSRLLVSFLIHIVRTHMYLSWCIHEILADACMQVRVHNDVSMPVHWSICMNTKKHLYTFMCIRIYVYMFPMDTWVIRSGI